MTETQKDPKRQSAYRTTKLQLNTLLEAMEQNPEVARGTSKNSQTQFWDNLALRLNALGPPSKTGKEWLKVWMEKKYNTRRKLAENKKQFNMTGGGVAQVQKLDEFDERVIVLSNIEKALAGVPDAICIGIPSDDDQLGENINAQEEPGPSKPSPLNNRKTKTDSSEPPRKKTAFEKPIDPSIQANENEIAGPSIKSNPKDFTQIVIDQNQKIIENLSKLNESVSAFVSGSLSFQEEILQYLKNK